MRYLQRYLSLLFALVMSVSLFSVTVLADEVTSTDKVHIVVGCTTNNEVLGQYDVAVGDTDSSQFITSVDLSKQAIFRTKFVASNYDSSILVPKGRDFEFIIENITNTVTLTKAHATTTYIFGSNTPLGDGDFFYVLTYADGTEGWFGLGADDYIYNAQKKNHSIKLNMSASQFDKDIIKIGVYEYIKFTDPFSAGGTGEVTVHSGFEYPLKVSLNVATKEQGLLGGILGKITDLWKTAEAGFANIVKGITELPQKLWSLIENGLKNLFVPNEQEMVAYKDKWDQLLSSRLGAVYQVVNVLTDSWDGVMAADQTDTIEFPQATINLAGTPFTFGGYSVKIVPDGFGVLVTAIKSIVAIVCTVAFVNGMRKRYDEVMGVET